MSQEFYTNCVTVGNRVLYRGYKNGSRVHRSIEYKPSLFISSNKSSKFKTLEGKSVEKIEFSGIEDAREFLKKYESIDNFTVYGNTNYHYCYLSDTFTGQVDYDPNQVKVMFLDIETSYEDGFPNPQSVQEPVIAITIKLKDKFYVYGTKEFKTEDKNVFYFKCDDEKDLLSRFVQKWQELDPDIISGWNIEEFDIPYLINRISRVLSEKDSNSLSPWKRLRTRKVKLQGREYDNFELIGISTLDYLQMYRKFVGTAENYKLNTIAQMELGEGKVQGDMRDMYHNDHQKFIEYNIQDVALVAKIDQKMGLIQMLCAIAYDAKVNIVDTFAQVRLWDTIIFNDFRPKHLVMPQKAKHDKETRYAGAFVKEPKVGMHKWVASFDLDSLYPHLLAQYNISPEMLVPGAFKTTDLDKLLKKEYDLSYLKERGLTMAANGHHFKTDKEGFLPAILMRMYQDRKVYKNKMLDSQNELERVEAEFKRRGL